MVRRALKSMGWSQRERMEMVVAAFVSAAALGGAAAFKFLLTETVFGQLGVQT